MEGMSIESAMVPRRETFAARLRRFLEGPWLLLGAVGLVVVLVSLPLLQDLAVKENELDAIRTMDLLGREVFAAEAPAATLGGVVQGNELLLERLPDTRLLKEGRLLFRHGYLFELLRSESGARVLRAWPFHHGRTGLGAFWSTTEGKLFGHPNSRAAWSGVASPPTSLPAKPTAAPDWRRVPLSLSRAEGL